MESEPRIDPTHGTRVHVVGARQNRPNTARASSVSSCPFCVGGLECPEPYDVRWFPNRWPALPDRRCEVLLYSPLHDATLATLAPASARRLVDLWTERTAHFARRGDVGTLMIFENRGADVGATIDHPHGQLYAFDHVPHRSRERLSWLPPREPALRLASEHGWHVAVPAASQYPVALEIWPNDRAADLTELSGAQLDGLAVVLQRTMRVLDGLYDRPLPYMMWFNQRDFSSSDADNWLHVEIVSPWRDADVMRYIAGVEVSTGEFFNPVVPEELATRLRQMFGDTGGNFA